VATFALAQDSAFGQPLESQLRSCLLADMMCAEAGFDEDIAVLAETLVFDTGDPGRCLTDTPGVQESSPDWAEPPRDLTFGCVLELTAPGASPLERVGR
jgi:hypothetical protein